MITEGVPVCVATDRLRPCTAAEALAYEYLSRHHDGGVGRYAPEPGQQQSFVDERGNGQQDTQPPVAEYPSREITTIEEEQAAD